MENYQIQHTAGEWKTHHNEGQGFDFVTDKYNNCIAKVLFNEHHIKADAVRANAKLIAAAPELLKTAISCMNIADRCNNAMLPTAIQELLKSIETTLKEAINKATNQ